jgi:hypothetical protein
VPHAVVTATLPVESASPSTLALLFKVVMWLPDSWVTVVSMSLRTPAHPGPTCVKLVRATSPATHAPTPPPVFLQLGSMTLVTPMPALLAVAWSLPLLTTRRQLAGTTPASMAQ